MSQRLGDETKGVIAIVVSATMYGFTGLFIRFLTGIGLNVYSINFVEYLMGTVLIYFIADRWGGKIELPLRKEWLYLMFIGFCYFGVTMTLFYAFNYTTIANTELLHYTFPILTVFGAALFLNERLNGRKVLALVLSMAGLVLIFDQSLNFSQKVLFGSFCALLSAFPVAAMTLIGRKLRNRSAYFTTFWSIAFACVIYFPFFISNNSISNMQQVGYIFVASVFFIGITTPLYFYSLRHIAASTTAILMLFEIISGIIIGLIVYQEVPRLVNLLGGLLIVISCVLVLRDSYKNIADEIS
ncbi:MAG: DMT family transporter [Thermodesulfobacteriota bacterium]|nr:DMT family transporter [Thermodesulfobacteriota bacterium]